MSTLKEPFCYGMFDKKLKHMFFDEKFEIEGYSNEFNPYPEEPLSFYGGYSEFIYMKNSSSTSVKVEAKPDAAVLQGTLLGVDQ
ncbi:MAG: hypothetical protein QXL67_03660 [Candidatus Bathyarchaeia archaeon]